MIFHAEKDLDFELGGKRYVVPAGSDGMSTQSP